MHANKHPTKACTLTVCFTVHRQVFKEVQLLESKCFQSPLEHIFCQNHHRNIYHLFHPDFGTSQLPFWMKREHLRRRCSPQQMHSHCPTHINDISYQLCHVPHSCFPWCSRLASDQGFQLLHRKWNRCAKCYVFKLNKQKAQQHLLSDIHILINERWLRWWLFTWLPAEEAVVHTALRWNKMVWFN